MKLTTNIKFNFNPPDEDELDFKLDIFDTSINNKRKEDNVSIIDLKINKNGRDRNTKLF